GLCLRKRVHKAYAMAAAPIGIPGCPLSAFCTASTERKRRVLTHSLSKAGLGEILEDGAFIRASLGFRATGLLRSSSSEAATCRHGIVDTRFVAVTVRPYRDRSRRMRLGKYTGQRPRAADGEGYENGAATPNARSPSRSCAGRWR